MQCGKYCVLIPRENVKHFQMETIGRSEVDTSAILGQLGLRIVIVREGRTKMFLQGVPCMLIPSFGAAPETLKYSCAKTKKHRMLKLSQKFSPN